ncbi:uncharacterized protein FIBRA_01400 [Fibroporia radiculosa]|uniref:Uncharacterized protein n=1 Tax=Fibroporia radiculosa TaxID=599839 RepID=J4HTA6_9APHY|nr:uncharacterized protein FIBRA_01400 [Fibroporia radiculosa]CCL99382.1 predicted protein [Fibroporia radiculosa]
MSRGNMLYVRQAQPPAGSEALGLGFLAKIGKKIAGIFKHKKKTKSVAKNVAKNQTKRGLDDFYKRSEAPSFKLDYDHIDHSGENLRRELTEMFERAVFRRALMALDELD